MPLWSRWTCLLVTHNKDLLTCSLAISSPISKCIAYSLVSHVGLVHKVFMAGPCNSNSGSGVMPAASTDPPPINHEALTYAHAAAVVRGCAFPLSAKLSPALLQQVSLSLPYAFCLAFFRQ
jgi:hypothetical protein